MKNIFVLFLVFVVLPNLVLVTSAKSNTGKLVNLNLTIADSNELPVFSSSISSLSNEEDDTRLLLRYGCRHLKNSRQCNMVRPALLLGSA